MDMTTPQFRAMGLPGRIELAVENARKQELLTQALESLQREGHSALAWGAGPGKPYVLLIGSSLLAAMAEAGKGVYYMRGYDDIGHYRKGQLLAYRNVTVTWIERGH